MQKARPKQEVEQNVTLSTSVQAVQTLLETGIGCISYLRGLFPDDNFLDSKIEAPRAPVSSLNPPSLSKQVEDKKNAPITLKVKKLNKGHSEEADKLINYLEVGALDALKNSYLHQLPIYLDPDDPTNLVECYTFTFSYSIDAYGHKHPDMVVRDKMSGMVLSTKASTSKEGSKAPVKEGHLKRQIQKLIKNLIASTQVLEELPRRRFINVRLYFTDDTPEDYQPPLFRPVELSETHFRITTSKVDEIPDLATLGSISTGFHGVTLQMVSIAPLLEVPYDENVSTDECLARNKLDASTRRVEWDANSLVANSTVDTEGKQVDITPLGIMDDNGVLRSVVEVEKSEWKDLKGMVGIKSEDARKSEEEEREKLIYARGERERLEKIKASQSDNEALLEAIQARKMSVDSSQVISTQSLPVVSRQRSNLPPIPLFNDVQNDRRSSFTIPDAETEIETVVIPARKLKPVKEVIEEIEIEEQETRDEEETRLEEETQDETIVKAKESADAPSPNTADPMNLGYHTSSINSFIIAEDETQYPDMLRRDTGSKEKEPELFDEQIVTRNRSRTSTEPIKLQRACSDPNKIGKDPPSLEIEADLGVACDCGDSSEDSAMVLCATCKYWKHLVCYGYLDSEDRRIPAEFLCYSCLAKAGTGDTLLNSQREGEVEKALTDLQSLALFRRALDSLWENGLEKMKALSERLGVDSSTAAQVIKRLRTEKFTIDAKNTTKTRLCNAKSTPRGQMIVNESQEQIEFGNDEYFNPGKGAELEARMILEYTEFDAEGELDVLSRKSTRNRSLAKDETPKQPIIEINNPAPGKVIMRAPTLDDDPIIDDDEESPINALKSRIPLQVTVNSPSRKQVPAPYVPSFNKAKGKATTSSNSSFQRASSIQAVPSSVAPLAANSDAMDLDEEETRYDESGPGPQTLAAAEALLRSRSGKRRADENNGRREEGENDNMRTTRSKRQKCSEADQLEI